MELLAAAHHDEQWVGQWVGASVGVSVGVWVSVGEWVCSRDIHIHIYQYPVVHPLCWGVVTVLDSKPHRASLPQLMGGGAQ